MSQYLLSIVVPTHNRSKYAIPCIQSLLEISSDRLQVVVHDTSNDACELAAWAETVSDTRLRYIHWQDRLSMTDNHERAMELAEGVFVCLIGDDDTVSQRIVEIADFADREGLDLLTPQVKASYYWPDFRTKFFGDAHAGRIYLGDFDCTVAAHDSSERLANALQQACQGTDALPKLYHGLVRNSLLAVLKARNGRLFFGTSPDMSAAVSLAAISKRYALLDFPFTMPGGGGGSNSGRSAMGKHKGDLKKDPHMEPFKDLAWPGEIPMFFSVETVWAHAAWVTLEGMNEQQSLSAFNLARLYALCLFHHSDYKSQVLQARRTAAANGRAGVGRVDVAWAAVKVISHYVLSRLKRLTKPSASNGLEVVGVVDDVCLARRCLDQRLEGVRVQTGLWTAALKQR